MYLTLVSLGSATQSHQRNEKNQNQKERKSFIQSGFPHNPFTPPFPFPPIFFLRSNIFLSLLCHLRESIFESFLTNFSPFSLILFSFVFILFLLFVSVSF